MSPLDYWKEGISDAACEIGLVLTEEQLTHLAKAVNGFHDCYDMAFYTPPPSDRISEIEREYEAKLKAAESRHETYRHNAETAVKEALRQHPDDSVGIEEDGRVYRYSGRITQIQ